LQFGILWKLLQPLILPLIQCLLPWLIDRITADVKAGRPTVITDSDIRMQVARNREAVRARYKGH
jgi:hypothetical protein